MEDFDNYKIFFYILIAILYFLFSGKKKPAEKPKPVQQNQPPVKEVYNAPAPVTQGRMLKNETFNNPPDTQAEKKPYSLEEVLREFSSTLEEKKQEVKNLEVEDKFKPTVVDYDEDIEDEESIAEREKGRGIEMVPGQDPHFVPYAMDEKHENKYAAFLSHPDGIKTAFVAQEILNRKHF